MAELKILKTEQKILDFLQVKEPKKILNVYPYRYEAKHLTKFKDWKQDDQVFFNAKLISKPRLNRYNRVSVAKFDVLYEDNVISCVIYNRDWITSLNVGSIINIDGKYKGNYNVNVSTYNTNDLKDELGLHPVYHLTSGITIFAYRKFVKKVLKHYYDKLYDPIPNDLKEKYKLLDQNLALKFIHFPNNKEEVNQGIRTLKYLEFLRFHLINLIIKSNNQNNKLVKIFNHDEVFLVANALKFNLTNDQRIATNEILEDLSSNKIMNRLLQGDVGSGKTLVAALAMYATVLANQQTAFMAPTEILAIQQTKYFKDLFRGFDINIVCLYSALKTFKKDAVLEEIANGKAQIVVGTHSLIQDKLKFNNLGLNVIDEQQRFGVKQRVALNQKGVNVDQLLMTATPIPRTMASVMFSELDVSTIEELPLGRKDIKTKLILENTMNSILSDVLKQIENKNRVYVVCPAIDNRADSDIRNVNNIYKALNEEINNKQDLNIPIGLLHGKLDSNSKDSVMNDFKKGDIKILVTTTVIEVGIDVKEANIIVIYDADRFGLSQLHQLRGRVGRGNNQGYCYLLTNSKDQDTIKRLEVLESTLDGFKISEYDLQIRGPGDLIGTRQSGVDSFVLGDFYKDQVMLQYALKDAKKIWSNKNKADYNAIIKLALNYIEKNKDVLEG